MQDASTLDEDQLPHYSEFPQTRFQGSKLRLLDWIDKELSMLNYDTVLDPFSGSGVVSYYFKTQGKAVTSSDVLHSSYITALALVENSTNRIDDRLLQSVLDLPPYQEHDHVIEKNYEDINYTVEENQWLDAFISNIRSVSNSYHQAILYWALFQACLIKRPYNLFHRKNLYMRTDKVKRSFGNKVSWDRPFETYIRRFVNQANSAIFDNGRTHRAFQSAIEDLSVAPPDLLYIDPPYMKQNSSQSGNDYQNYYHFLEGILDYDHWSEKINSDLKHQPYSVDKSEWIDRDHIVAKFDALFDRFQDSILVISYNTEGYPSPDQLRDIIGSYKSTVEIRYKEIKYALKKKKRKNTEVLIIATD